MCGIPGSGKSTLVKKIPFEIEFANNNYYDFVIINSDDIRKTLLVERGFPDAIHQNTISDEILSVEDKIKLEDKVWYNVKMGVTDNLSDDKNVIIDATNTEQKVLNKWFEFGKEWYINIKVIIMTTPLDICIERNNAREQPIPEDVMSYMYNSYILTVSWLYENHSNKIINSEHL